MEPASLILFAVPVLLIALMALAQRRRQRTFTALQDQLAPGQDIVTTSGLFARLVEIGETVAVLEIGPGQQVRWDRRAIARVVQPPAELPTSGRSAGHQPHHES